MNTPKLLSIISSTIGKVDPAHGGRVADSTHGLDFSQLLGERRNQAAAPATTPRPSQTEARRNSAADAPSRPGNAAAGQNDNRRDTSNAAVRDNTPSAPAAANKPSGETGARPNDTVAARDSDTSAQQPSSGTQASPATDARPGDAADVPHDTGVGAPTDVQLAQQAAEAGLAAVVVTAIATQAAPASAGAGAGAGAGATVPGQAAQVVAAPLAANAAATQPAGAAALAALDAEGLTQPTAPQAGQDPRLAAGQQALVAQTGAAQQPAPTLAQVAGGIPSAAGIPATTGAGAIDTPATGNQQPAAQALPMPVVADISSGTAVAQSLQEFTAMVAAARATSGTALAPAALAGQPSANPFGIPGLMPAGMLPGQGFGAAPLAAGIATPLNSPQWSTEFGRQFISIAQAARGVGQVAELRLDPPDLGPLRITISLSDNVAQAVFSSPHAVVRQAVENALPQLQQMLEQAGISLGQANVNDQHQPGQPGQQHAGGNRQSLDGGDAAGNGLADAAAVRQGRPADPSALVDTFA